MSLNQYLVAALITVSLAALWQFDRYRLIGDSAALVLAESRSSEQRLTESNAAMAQALIEQSATRSMLSVISTETRQLNATLDTQSRQIRRDLAELKRTDAEVNAYLSGLVPAALGLRYARPATTDPAAWRAAAEGVRAGPVPAAGTPSPEP